MDGDDNDLDDRVDDFNRRAAEAREADGVLGELISVTERNRKVTNLLAIVVAVVAALMLLLGALAATVWHNTGVIAQQAEDACVQSAKNSVVINEFLNLLIVSADASNLFSDEEAERRIIGYKTLLIDIPDCHEDN